MKNRIILYTFIALASASCSNYFDKPHPTAIVAEEINREAYPVLRIGLYDAIQWGNRWVTEDLSADNLVYRTSYYQHGEIDDNRIAVTNSYMNTDWSNIFRTVVACNKFLTALEQETDKSAMAGGLTVNQYIAEARYIRAYCYYHGVKFFGDFPYVDENTTEAEARTITRSPASLIVSKVLEDLKFAQANTRPHSTSGPKYISQEAVSAFLARVYLFVDDLSNAGVEAERVIASTSVGITNDYLGIWRASNDKELIFYITGHATDENVQGFYLRDNTNFGRFELPVNEAIVADFAHEPSDTRRVVIENSTIPSFPFQCVKYNNSDNSDIWPVSRVAEMYLISAEASGYPGGLSRLNELRANRGLPNLTTDDITNETEFYTALMRERRLELCFEGHRWTDLRRMCKKYNLDITQYLPNISGINDFNLLYPVPNQQILLNPNLTQNPGY